MAGFRGRIGLFPAEAAVRHFDLDGRKRTSVNSKLTSPYCSGARRYVGLALYCGRARSSKMLSGSCGALSSIAVETECLKIAGDSLSTFGPSQDVVNLKNET